MGDASTYVEVPVAHGQQLTDEVVRKTRKKKRNNISGNVVEKLQEKLSGRFCTLKTEKKLK